MSDAPKRPWRLLAWFFGLIGLVLIGSAVMVSLDQPSFSAAVDAAMGLLLVYMARQELYGAGMEANQWPVLALMALLVLNMGPGVLEDLREGSVAAWIVSLTFGAILLIAAVAAVLRLRGSQSTTAAGKEDKKWLVLAVAVAAVVALIVLDMGPRVLAGLREGGVVAWIWSLTIGALLLALILGLRGSQSTTTPTRDA